MAGLQFRHASDDFVSLLEKASVSLDSVARKIDNEFSSRYAGSGVNPMQLCKRINSLSQQIPSLQADITTVIQRKQALVDAAKQQLLTNRSQLHELSTKCGAEIQEDPRQLSDFSLALKSWDQCAAQHKVQDIAHQPSTAYMTRDELNKALAGSMLAR